jgi:hypothetical protein
MGNYLPETGDHQKNWHQSKLPIRNLVTQWFTDHDIFFGGYVVTGDLWRVVQAVDGVI